MALTLTPILTSIPYTEPADGFSVLFWDSEYKLIPKGYADSLGYSNYYGELGTDALSAREGLSQPVNNSITVRSSDTFKWSVITRTDNLSTEAVPVTLHQVVSSVNDIVYKRCRVRLQNNGTLLKVEIKDDDGNYQTYLEQELVATGTPANAVYNSVNTMPDTLNVGLCFSSGKTTSNCWIKNFSVYGDTVTNNNASTILDSLTGLTVVHPTSAG